MEDIDYGMAMDVTTSWDRIKRMSGPTFAEVVGEDIMLKAFSIEPQTMKVFNFSSDDYLKSQPSYKHHCKTMVEMIDCAVSFVGPGIEAFQGEIEDLGIRHRELGVKENYFDVMIQAVVATLQKHMGTAFTEQEKNSWEVVLKFITSIMIIGFRK